MLENSIVGIGTAVSAIVFFVGVSWKVSSFQTKTNSQIKRLEDSVVRLWQAVDTMKKSDNDVQVSLAEIKTTLEYIKTILKEKK